MSVEDPLCKSLALYVVDQLCQWTTRYASRRPCKSPLCRLTRYVAGPAMSVPVPLCQSVPVPLCHRHPAVLPSSYVADPLCINPELRSCVKVFIVPIECTLQHLRTLSKTNCVKIEVDVRWWAPCP